MDTGSTGKDAVEMKFYIAGELRWVLNVSIDLSQKDTYIADYYSGLNLIDDLDAVIELEGDFSEPFIEAVSLNQERPQPANRHPVIHFAADNGWINDPNGLYFQDGVYHLYFQYNEFDNRWNNISWGHAVSHDLLHWEQLDTVLYPDAEGTMHSGCAILSEKEAPGLPKDTPVFFYTCAGGNNAWSGEKKYVQKFAYSMDGGKTLIKDDRVLIDHIADLNRDPKVYWYEPGGYYYMVLFLQKHEFAVFISQDLTDWERTQTISPEPCWECPDFREIPASDGSKQWVFWCADGFYYICDFDGREIKLLSERKEAYRIPLAYAAQTFYGTPDRVVMVPWMTTKNDGCTYRGMMGLPRELSLMKQGDSYSLSMKPVREYLKQREEILLPYKGSEPAAVELVFQMNSVGYTAVMVYGLEYRYDYESGVVMIGGHSYEFQKHLPEIHFLIDKDLVEISAQQDTVYGAIETKNQEIQGEITLISMDDGSAVTAYVI